MAKKVWKWVIPYHSHLTVSLPVNAKPVKVGMQYNHVVIWIELDTEVTDKVDHVFKAFPTGGEIPWKTNHIDTIFDSGYVWHVYEVLGEFNG